MLNYLLAPYRRNPKAAKIEIAVVLLLNGIMLAINVFIIGLPLDDMLVIKCANVAFKAPVAPQYYAVRDHLYAKETQSRVVRVGLDMVAWGIFQTTLYGGITTAFMGVFWLFGSTHFQFPTHMLAESVALVWVTATFLAGPITTFRDDLKAWLAPDQTEAKKVIELPRRRV